MPQSDTPPVVDAVNDDESVRVDIAVRALGDMRSKASASASSSGEGRASSRNSRNGERDDGQQQPAVDGGFVSRMTSFPIVGTALRAYEQGKASSRVVKYGVQMVESSVKTISRPVIDRLPVNQIDEFACRQLDRLDRYRRPSTGPESISPRSPASPPRTHSSMSRHMSDVNDAGSPSTLMDHESDRGRLKLRTKTFDGSQDFDDEERLRGRYEEDEGETKGRRSYVGGDRSVPQWIESTNSYSRTSGSGAVSPMDNSRIGSPITVEDRRTRSPEQQTSQSRNRHSTNDREMQNSQQQNQNPDQQVAQRSRWQAMLLEAGGLGVALSDENMRRLKYCLNWLLYATAHIDAQILILRDFIESIRPMPQTNSSNRRPPISEEQLRKLTEVRKDIVSTVRQMVDVVSKYAGGTLPEPARGKVRGFILKLPQRWASRTAAAGVGGAAAGPTSGAGAGERERERESVAAAGSSTGALRRGQGRDKRAAQRERGTGSRAASPAPSDSHGHSPHQSQSGPPANQQISHSNASAAAQRILTLATESLDMMRNVTGVVKDSLDRADAWVNRLRMVGVQRGGQDSTNDESLNEEFGPPRVGSQYDNSSKSREDYRALFQTHRRGGSSSSTIPGEDETSFSGSTVASAPSPGAIPLASMHIASRFNTPKMGVSGLPLMEDDDGVLDVGSNVEEKVRGERERERLGKMEVDS
ncbi:Transcriptional repressor OPI1 [Leucoagaricus sp. SymC.cos]|nr:Transcriptional repressor OPI1 [Leucoagaricus sp. SymC.cos]